MRPAANWIDSLPTDRLMAEMSLWSADLGRLEDEIKRVDALTDIYHIDVADGHFSPALLFFPDLVALCRKHTSKPLHVHLMATDDILEDQIRQFAEAGADLISIHAENADIDGGLKLIGDLGLVSGIVLQLQTAVADVGRYLDRIGMLTLLGTRIGVKGQGLDEQAEPRLREAADLIANKKSSNRVVLAADGGIREHTVPGLRLAGAETIVMGSLAFNAKDFNERMDWVHAQPVER
ncbi:ribulose-phosphate 3-epimerase [Rhizobium leguminosarum]|uniref:ribulose-phosphate 3-epimerase n=1 Tax=Rhizobium leguminosarum TaxID=384 RepID=UPI0014428CFB|nr:ribulose-phosphate 3-epimerase [Rhizobium leguminosarum]MBY5904193.1 ribulose-phosphate 3-epimerase [Rhizobium leguminosarum]MBY5911562.1 ribulose-phosphate 3-epimerase [Rhizobium leguminosarum]NKK89183.1 D-allulose-6-phosphate 3-epimerase [Rhizobium leguminosarum bv. viciae]